MELAIGKIKAFGVKNQPVTVSSMGEVFRVIDDYTISLIKLGNIHLARCMSPKGYFGGFVEILPGGKTVVDGDVNVLQNQVIIKGRLSKLCKDERNGLPNVVVIDNGDKRHIEWADIPNGVIIDINNHGYIVFTNPEMDTTKSKIIEFPKRRK